MVVGLPDRERSRPEGRLAFAFDCHEHPMLPCCASGSEGALGAQDRGRRAQGETGMKSWCQVRTALLAGVALGSAGSPLFAQTVPSGAAPTREEIDRPDL